VALVVGNAAYKTSPLRNPVNDSRAVCASLKVSGFSAACVENATREVFRKALAEFQNDLRPGDVALFYYAGHGFQSDGQNFLVPTDVSASTEGLAQFDSISAALIMRIMAERKASLQIVILDACRDNPYQSNSSRSLGSRGLAPMQAPTNAGFLIAYAAAPGEQADDNLSGSNGLFTEHLLKSIEKPGITAYAAFDEAVKAVKAASRGAQQPWLDASNARPFYFRSAPAGGTAPPNARAADSNAVSLETRSVAANHMYQAIEKSTDPAESAALIERFLADYADLPLAVEVEFRKKKLTSANQPGPDAPRPSFNPVDVNTSPPPAPFSLAAPGSATGQEVFTSDGKRFFARFLSDADVARMTPAELQRHYLDTRARLGWDTTTGVARDWWLEFEKMNTQNVPTLTLLSENLLARKVTISEFFLAYVYSDVDSVEGNLFYLDYLNAGRNPYPEYVRGLGRGDASAALRQAFAQVQPGPNGAQAQQFFATLHLQTEQEAASAIWLFQQAAYRGITLTELRDCYVEAKMTGVVLHPLYFYAGYRRLHAAAPSSATSPASPQIQQPQAVPGNTEAAARNLTNQVRKALDQGRWQDALSAADLIKQLAPESPEYLNDRCYFYAKAGRPADALADCNEAVERDPQSAAIRDSRGYAYFKLGDFGRAITDFNLALALDPRLGETYYHRSLAFSASGDSQRAAADQKQYQRLRFKPKPADVALDVPLPGRTRQD
jgi:uncharacterized caspase-like protein/Flp pilus assembly protein TadD